MNPRHVAPHVGVWTPPRVPAPHPRRASLPRPRSADWLPLGAVSRAGGVIGAPGGFPLLRLLCNQRPRAPSDAAVELLGCPAARPAVRALPRALRVAAWPPGQPHAGPPPCGPLRDGRGRRALPGRGPAPGPVCAGRVPPPGRGPAPLVLRRHGRGGGGQAGGVALQLPGQRRGAPHLPLHRRHEPRGVHGGHGPRHLERLPHRQQPGPSRLLRHPPAAVQAPDGADGQRAGLHGRRPAGGHEDAQGRAGGAEGADGGVPAAGGPWPARAAGGAGETAGRPGADGILPPRQPGAASPGGSPDRQRAAAGGSAHRGHHQEDGEHEHPPGRAGRGAAGGAPGHPGRPRPRAEPHPAGLRQNRYRGRRGMGWMLPAGTMAAGIGSLHHLSLPWDPWPCPGWDPPARASCPLPAAWALGSGFPPPPESDLALIQSYQSQTGLYYEELMGKLQRVNRSLGQVLGAVEHLQSSVESRLQHVQSVIAWTGVSLGAISTCTLHAAYFLLAALLLAFLQTPGLPRAALLVLVAANALSELQRAASLGFPALTALLVLVIMGHWLLTSVCHGAWRVQGQKPRLTLLPTPQRAVGARADPSSRRTSTPDRECETSLLKEELHQLEDMSYLPDGPYLEPDSLRLSPSSTAPGPGLGHATSLRRISFARSTWHEVLERRATPDKRHPGLSPASLLRCYSPNQTLASDMSTSLLSPRSLCQGVTRAGQPCRKKAVLGQNFCHVHA